MARQPAIDNPHSATDSLRVLQKKPRVSYRESKAAEGILELVGSFVVRATTFASERGALLYMARKNRDSDDLDIVGNHISETATGIYSAYVDDKF